ncbi:MAG: M23 family metallopeptidase [Bacteroidales bacterium]
MGRYNFDKDKFQFEEDKNKSKTIITTIIWLLISSVALSILYYLIFALFFSTPAEKKIIAENKIIKKEYADINNKVVLLDDAVKDLEIRDQKIYREIFHSNPPDFNQTSIDTTSFMEDNDFAEIIVEYTGQKISKLEYEVGKNDLIVDSLTDFLNNDAESLRNIPSKIPLENFTILQTGAGIGKKMHPYYKTLVYHEGIDLIANLGANVLAAADGVVQKVYRSSSDKGNYVAINHGNGYITYYYHLGLIKVRTGRRVKGGDVIGEVGTTGISFAPHLHYEVKLNDSLVDPMNFFFGDINPAIFRQMLMISMTTGQSLD